MHQVRHDKTFSRKRWCHQLTREGQKQEAPAGLALSTA
jgi:hypothetical protein